jgi:Leucine-rich repeat (LRR) protein
MNDYAGINKLSKLKILILDKCPLNTIPNDVCHLYNVEVITISESQISYLPD